MQKIKKALPYIIVFCLIPLILFLASSVFDNKKYYFISLLIISLLILPFIISFEKREKEARELVLIGVLVSLGVLGRTAFFVTQQFKPVVAIVIISGVCLGKERGFLVGALIAFASNFFFGQGPWTPWQMFAFGLIGFMAGGLATRSILKKDKLSLAIFGGLSSLLVYGPIMNFASLVMVSNQISLKAYLASMAAGLVFDLIHAFSTVFFLLVLSGPMIEKIDRIKIKYGIIDS